MKLTRGKYFLINVVVLIVYIVTAYNSHGFYHADEHYQLIEFAGIKLETHSSNDLAWEFNSQIRPTLQPTIVFVLIKVFEEFNIVNPYSQTFLLRLITAFFAIVTILLFVRNTRGEIKSSRVQVAYYLLSFFLWFIPFISVRFSSETWSGLFFLLALAFYFKEPSNIKLATRIGLLLGLSFLFRFQIAFAIFGFVLWLIFFTDLKVKYFVNIGLAFIAVVALGTLIDFWFYGELLFTPWNYFYTNIIEGVASGFGSSPWHFYFLKLLTYPTYFIGVPIFLSIVILILYKPRNCFLWIVLAFIIGHSVIDHKEERFLFPIVFLFPIILIESYQILIRLVENKRLSKIFNYVLIVLFVVVNSVGLIVMSNKAAGVGRMELTKYIHDKYYGEKVNIISTKYANPYDPWRSLPMKFYLEKNMIDTRITSLCQFNDTLFVSDAVNLLAIRKHDLKNVSCSINLEKLGFEFKIQSVPKWIEDINKSYDGFDNSNILELYKYNK